MGTPTGGHPLAETILRDTDPDAVIDLCRELIRLRTENPPGDLREGTRFVTAYLARHGISAETFEPQVGRVSVVARTGGASPAGPAPARTLVFNGHLDVVPAGDPQQWKVPPFSGEIRDGYVWGRGASDMKGGLAALMVAFAALARHHDKLPGRVVLSVVPDEETGGHFGTEWLLDKGHLTGDGCIIGEPSGPDPTIGQKGSVWLLLRTRGEPGHGSLSPIKGHSAIREMAAAVEAAYSLFDRRWPGVEEELRRLVAESQEWIGRRGSPELGPVYERVTVNAGVIRGGSKVNVVAESCEVELDLRVPWGVSSREAVTTLEGIFRERGLRVEVTALSPAGEANYTSPREPVVQALLDAAAAVTGKRPVPVLQYASSDARFFRRKGIPTLQYGPAELGGIHGYNERVPVTALRQAVQVYVEAAVRFLAP